MRSRFALFLAVSGLLLSVSAGLAADGKGKWTRCKHAKYKAKQIGNTVVLVSYGTHPTSGYQVKFRRLPTRSYPPQFEFLDQKPGGFTSQVITPFAEIAHFKASGIVKSVVIHDGIGKHTVKVEQAQKK